MGIFGWLMRHLLLVMVIAGGVVAVVFWDQIAKPLGLEQYADKIGIKGLDLAKLWPTAEKAAAPAAAKAPAGTAGPDRTAAPQPAPATPQPKFPPLKPSEGAGNPFAASPEPAGVNGRPSYPPLAEPQRQAGLAGMPFAPPQQQFQPRPAGGSPSPFPPEEGEETARQVPAPMPMSGPAMPGTPPAIVAAPQPAPAAAPPPAPASVAAPAPAPAAAPAPVMSPAPAAPPQAATEATPVGVMPPPTAQPGSAPALGDALRAGWIEARRAHVSGNIEDAERRYKALMRDFPDEPDLAGELGNIYYAQGKNDSAADMFMEAGQRMLRGPNPERAGILLGILNRLDQNKASALRKALFETRRQRN